jgi:hypothetical protein
MAVNSPTSCFVEIELFELCGRIFKAMIYAFAITMICVVFCASAVVSQLRENRRQAGADAQRNTATIASSISRNQLLQDVRDYAQDARANKDAAHALVLNARLGVPQAGTN